MGWSQRASTRGKVISPQSNLERSGDSGIRAHTNVELLIPNGNGANTSSGYSFRGGVICSIISRAGFRGRDSRFVGLRLLPGFDTCCRLQSDNGIPQPVGRK